MMLDFVDLPMPTNVEYKVNMATAEINVIDAEFKESDCAGISLSDLARAAVHTVLDIAYEDGSKYWLEPPKYWKVVQQVVTNDNEGAPVALGIKLNHVREQ